MQDAFFSKIMTLDQAIKWRESAKRSNVKVVMTNGVFDLVTLGHMRALYEISQYGNMVVGVNSDSSVKMNKGPDRPIMSEYERLCALSFLQSVRALFLFDSSTVAPSIMAIKPDIYVKHGYTLQTLPESEQKALVEVGAKLELLPREAGFSTSGLIEKIKKLP